MERLTKTYDDGTFGVANDFPCVENSYAFKKMLIDRLGEYENLEEQELLLKLPCNVGDTIYIISKCDKFPPRLDGTMWDSDGGFGTATGYYCPYEDDCPFETDNCNEVKNVLNIFEDMVVRLCIEEDEIWFVCENSNGWETSDFGKTIFLSREEARKKLEQMKYMI